MGSVMLSLVHLDLEKLLPSLAVVKILVDRWKAVLAGVGLAGGLSRFEPTEAFFSVPVCMVLCIYVCDYTYTDVFILPAYCSNPKVCVGACNISSSFWG